MKGALVDALFAPPIVQGMCSSHSAMHKHHACVHELIDANKLRVDETIIPPAIQANVLPLPGAHWPDNQPLL
jgi:hypothetical protein